MLQFGFKAPLEGYYLKLECKSLEMSLVITLIPGFLDKGKTLTYNILQ